MTNLNDNVQKATHSMRLVLTPFLSSPKVRSFRTKAEAAGGAIKMRSMTEIVVDFPSKEAAEKYLRLLDRSGVRNDFCWAMKEV